MASKEKNGEKNVFITGVSGYFGMKLVEHFARKKDVKKIIGIDINKPPRHYEKLEFIIHDVRADMTGIMKDRDIDWAIHAAYVLAPIHNKNLMEDININGTMNFFSSCAAAGVPDIMQVSSTTAYGFYRDNPPLLDEESPLRGNDDFTYAKNKKELELARGEFMKEHPGIRIITVRPCFVVGPGFKNPLAGHLKKRIVMLPSDTGDFQFVHEDDLVEIMYLLLYRGKSGVYNITADGTMTFYEMVRMLGGMVLKIPPVLIYPLVDLAWFLRLKFLTEFPSPALNLMRYPWIAGNSKIKKALNYTFKYNTQEAFADFAHHVKSERKDKK